MQIENKELFISEYAQMLQSKDYLAYIEKLKNEMNKRRKGVFADYTSNARYQENQLYNEKNAIVEVLTILLEARDEFEKLKNSGLTGIKYVLDEINELIKGHTTVIETRVGGLNNGLTMSVYTETDIVLRGADAIESIITCYEKELENCKKVQEDDKALSEVKEDNGVEEFLGKDL